MLVAIEATGGATAEDVTIYRARAALGIAAETLAAVCRAYGSPEAVAAAADRVCEAFGEYGRRQLAAAAERARR